ncbi:DinB family protein [Roseivirga sp.]|uniref:DinB family protein n=1 Tax=Roseivirga sp. TaxID=1964215 RepID=UPI003B51896D
MKIKNKLAFAFLAIILFASQSFAHEGGYDWMKQRLEATKAYTIAVLEAMPEGDYTFKPNDEQRTFAAQAYHIVYSIDYFQRAFSQGPNAQWAPGDENSKSKKELIDWAKTKFDEINAFILEQESNDQLTAGVISFLDHNAHHRGQIITYLRLKGINPPQYR